MLRLWEEEEEPPLWLLWEVAKDRDLRMHLWVSKFAAHVPTTVCLQDGAEVDEHWDDGRSFYIAFEPTGAPDILEGPSDARDDALQVLHEQQTPWALYVANPLIRQNGLLSHMVRSRNDENGYEALTTEQTLIYLQQSVPWNSEP